MSKAELVVHRLPEDEQVTVPNTPAGVRRVLRRWAKEAGGLLVVCEATGGYERAVLAESVTVGLPVHRAHGSRTRSFARYIGQIAKTDPIDARMLALFGLGTRNLRLYVPPSPEEEALRALRKRRDEIDGLVRMEKNRLAHAHLPRVLRSLRGNIRRLEHEKAALEDEIEALIASAPDLARKAKLLRSIVGVGQHTTSAMLAYLPEIGTLTKSEAAGLTGTAPIANESGQHRGRRRLQGGRACVRDSLYMAALVARTYNPAIRRFAESLTARGKPPKLVLGAIMRRLAVLMNAVLKTDQPCRLNATA